jgi:flagellar biogenesis protein FliO
MTESPLLDFVKVMAILGGIVALAWAGLKYFLPKLDALRTLRGDLIEVIARQPLEARKTLYVVRAGSRHLLLASSGDAVTLLHELDSESPTFSQKLREVRGEIQS